MIYLSAAYAWLRFNVGCWLCDEGPQFAPGAICYDSNLTAESSLRDFSPTGRIADSNVSMNRQTSLKVLYIGTGATRMQPGFRLSQMIPAFSNVLLTPSIRSSRMSTLSWAPRSIGLDGVMTLNAASFLCDDREAIWSRRCSAYAVNNRDLDLSAEMSVCSKTDRDAVRHVRSIAEGFET